MTNKGLLLSIFTIGLLAFGCGEDLSQDEILQNARKFELEQNYPKAKDHYNKLLKQYPESSHAGEARVKVELIKNAQSWKADELFAQIEKYESKEEFENALILYNTLLDRFPEHKKIDEVLHKLGLIYLNHNEQYSRAVSSYERLLTEYPESQYAAQAQFMIGYIYANHLNDLEKARQAYITFKANYPDHELITSVNWELDHLGQDISEIDIFADSKDGDAAGNSNSSGNTDKPAQSGRE